ncbi:hypothetical protein LTR95_003574 [Oleoguttula sp. CCFEE 5521]
MHHELSQYITDLQEKKRKVEKNDALLLKALSSQRTATASASATPSAILIGSIELDGALSYFSLATFDSMYTDLRNLRAELRSQQEKLDDANAKLLVLVRAWRKPNEYVFPKVQVPDYSQGPWIFGDKIFTSTPGNSHSRALPMGQAYGRWERVRIHGLTDRELSDEALQKSISQDHSILNDEEPVPCHIFVAATHELRRSIRRPPLTNTAVWLRYIDDANHGQPLGTSTITVQTYNDELGEKYIWDKTDSVNSEDVFAKTGTLPEDDPRVRYIGPVADPASDNEDDEDPEKAEASGGKEVAE